MDFFVPLVLEKNRDGVLATVFWRRCFGRIDGSGDVELICGKGGLEVSAR